MSTKQKTSLASVFGIIFVALILSDVFPIAFFAPLILCLSFAMAGSLPVALGVCLAAGICMFAPAFWRSFSSLDWLASSLAFSSVVVLAVLRLVRPAHALGEASMETNKLAGQEDFPNAEQGRSRTPIADVRTAITRDIEVTSEFTIDEDLQFTLADTSEPEAVLKRLTNTGKFTRNQLALVEQELKKALSNLRGNRTRRILPPGTVIGDYTLLQLLAEGGAGQIYRARSRLTNQPVALKILSDVRMTERFKREMDLVQRLAHPNIVVAYDVGEHDGLPYLTMELLPGTDLNQFVQTNGPLPWREATQLILQAARGLEQAHQRGLLHRDVKPGNLVLDGSNNIKITDLGLGTILDRDAEPNITGEHVVAGTLEFMAPEQARSLSSADERADIYSLGATWFYLLKGYSRLKGNDLHEMLTALLLKPDLDVLAEGDAPANVMAVWEKMVAYSRDDRYASMSQVIVKLESILGIKENEDRQHEIRVLVIEDNSDDLFLTVELLKRINESVVVHSATTLQSGIEILGQAEPIDIVLLDLNLPDSSGTQTVEDFRAAYPDVALVVLTGQDDVFLGQECIKAGADDFACKNDLNAHILERRIFITLSRRNCESNFSGSGVGLEP